MSRLPSSDLTEATAHAAVYLRRLRREQLRLALLSLGAFGGAIGALPLILFLLPRLPDAHPLGVPPPPPPTPPPAGPHAADLARPHPAVPALLRKRPARTAPRRRARRGVQRT